MDKNTLFVPNNFSQDASPLGVFNEIDENLIEMIKGNKIYPKPLLICSGGTTTQCIADNHWTLDLRDKYNKIRFASNKNEIDIEAGITMKQLINTLLKYKRSFPIGLSGMTGLGYILTGGISPLSRSQGLAIDNIEKISGIWGSGKSFELFYPKNNSSSKEINTWKALCGAAPFLGIITSVRLRTYPVRKLLIWEAIISKEQLVECIKQAEVWPIEASLQWAWGEEINAYVVIDIENNDNRITAGKIIESLPFISLKKTSEIDGLHQLPQFKPQIGVESKFVRNYSEILGLLGNSWGSNSINIVNQIEELIKERPNKKCYIASQQLGGVTAEKTEIETSFIHRKAMWKPWITTTWDARDLSKREKSIEWMYKSWESLECSCPGLHLAQLHPHLPSHQKELKAAFGREWFEELKKIKSQYDPQCLLPPL